MATAARKRVGVRLVAENGQRVKAELEGIGDAGEKAFGRIEQKSVALRRGVTLAMAAVATAATAMGVAMVRSGLQTIQSQADVAQSLNTTVESVQALHHAADLAGVAVGEAEGGVRRLTRRLSLFAKDGGGPAAKAIEQLNLNAHELLALPIDQRIAKVNEALDKYATKSERAALLSQLFGDNSWMAFSRLNTETLEKATKDVHDFGVVVSEVDAAKIGRTNEALSRMGLIWRGIANQLTVAVAPSLEQAASAMAALASRTGPLGMAIELVFNNLFRLASYAVSFAAFMATRFVGALALSAAALLRAAIATGTLTGALVTLRGALIRTGIGALIVGAGELIYWFSRLVGAVGGFGGALRLLGEVAAGVWDGIVTSAKAIPPGLGAIWESVRAGFFRLLANLTQRWEEFLYSLAGSVQNVPGLDGVFGQLMDAAGRASAEFHGFTTAATQAEAKAAALREEAGRLVSEGFDKAGEAVRRLGDVIANANADAENALGGSRDAADDLADALDRAGKAGAKAGKKIKDASKEALTGWDKTIKALQDYAKEALDLAGGIGGAIVNAFQGAENAIVDFVKTGKLNFRDMITSFIADLARLAVRRFILGPIANALSGIFAGPRNPFAFIGGLSFDGGGHTGYGARVGGLDGKGGYLALVHPRERIIDETRGGGRGGGRDAVPVIVNISTPNAESFRQSRTQIAADIQRAVAMGRRGM